MIVDPEWQFGLELADCLATSGYQAILVRSLESMIDDLGEMQPGAILLHTDSYDDRLAGHGSETLQAVKILCPQAPVLTLTKPRHDSLTERDPRQCTAGEHSPPLPPTRVEELLRTKWGIPCARVL
jgi:DNA-binding response OmpR family regulator